MIKERLTDIIDMAAQRAEMFRESALAAHFMKPDLSTGKQRVVDDIIFCIECEEPIPPARLRALVGCIRCVECQQHFDDVR